MGSRNGFVLAKNDQIHKSVEIGFRHKQCESLFIGSIVLALTFYFRINSPRPLAEASAEERHVYELVDRGQVGRAQRGIKALCAHRSLLSRTSTRWWLLVLWQELALCTGAVNHRCPSRNGNQ